MKKLILSFSFIVVIVFFLSHTAYGQYTKWQKDVSCHNIKFEKVRFIIHETDTTYAEGVLAQKTTIDGYPCHKNIVFAKEWKLRQFILAEGFFMLETEFPEGTQVSFYKDRIHCFFGTNTQVQTYWCSGNYTKWYSMGISTSFYLSGKLKCFFPVDDIEINNILCKSSPFAGVCLHENGNLQRCKLAASYAINGKEYKKNTQLHFDETGTVISAK